MRNLVEQLESTKSSALPQTTSVESGGATRLSSTLAA